MTATMPAHTARPRGAHLTFGNVLHSEWIKLRSLRSTIWSYAIVVLVSLGLAFLVAFSLDATGMVGQASTHVISMLTVQASTFGVFFGQLAVAVLGVLFIGGEYSTGMIRSTLTAVPRRLPALAAKAVVLFVSSFVVGIVAAFGAFAVAAPILASHRARADIFDTDVFMPLIASAFYLAIVSVFALGLGTIVRSSAGGISTALGVIMLLPIALSIAPVQWMNDTVPYLLMNAGMATFGGSAPSGALDTWQQLLVIVAWAAVSLAIGAVLLKRRDA